MKRLMVGVAVAMLAACSSSPAGTSTAQTLNNPASEMIPATTKSPEALTHFRKGEALFYNIRPAEAAEEFSQALQLDPGFVLAHLYHGQSVTGTPAIKEIEDAAAAAGGLPESERLLILGSAAGTRGDSAKAQDLFDQLTKVAPADWRSHYALGFQLLADQQYAQAMTPLKKATELNRDAAVAHNMLGYASLAQGDTAGAVSAFEQYARLLPQEPNPQDSLGEALIAAGRFTDSEAAFNKALALSPQFWNAHEGLAFAKIYEGDWAGGRAELEKAKAGATRTTDRLGVDRELAAMAAAQGRTAEALQILDAAAKAADADPAALALIPVRRAEVLVSAGKPREAIAAVAPALIAAEDKTMPEALARPLRRQALRVRLTAESQLHDAQAVAATAALLQSEASAHPDDPGAQSAMHYANGMLALIKGDAAGARTHFERCSSPDDVCAWQGAIAAERAGDKTAAATARERLQRLYRRDPGYLMVRKNLAQMGERTIAQAHPRESKRLVMTACNMQFALASRNLLLGDGS